jgi:hypothetical protein
VPTSVSRHARAIERNRYTILDDSLAHSVVTDLRREAMDIEPTARGICGEQYRISRDGRVSSPRHHRTATPGPVLRDTHEDQELIDLVESVVERKLFPTRASYIYYQPGDYIGLHNDTAACHVTLITSIVGNLDPLIVHHELGDLNPEQLLEVSRRHEGRPPGGTPVQVPDSGRLLMLMGSAIPHHRPISLQHCAIATLCYAGLW